MKTGKTLQALAAEIARQNAVKKDYVANTTQMVMETQPSASATEDEPTFVPVLRIGELDPFGINGTAHDQIATKLGIPSKYYDRMREDDARLLAANVNHWFERQPMKRMVRTLDGNVRAFLSDRYRPIDHHEIAGAILPMIADMVGAKVESCEMTDTKLYIKVVNPRIEAEVVKGDVVQSGLLITNSETGHGAVKVMPLIYRLVCSNGLVAADSGKRKYHIGRINEFDDTFELYRDETIKADNAAFVMMLQDIVRATVDMVKFENIVKTMRDATKAPIVNKDIPKVIELTSKEYGFVGDESKGILDYLIRGGDLSLYGLTNAITAKAQEVESYDRSTELEMIAWDVMTMPSAKWNALNAA